MTGGLSNAAKIPSPAPSGMLTKKSKLDNLNRKLGTKQAPSQNNIPKYDHYESSEQDSRPIRSNHGGSKHSKLGQINPNFGGGGSNFGGGMPSEQPAIFSSSGPSNLN